VNNLDGRQLVLPANIFLYVRLARSVLAFLGGPSAANSGVTSLAEHAPSRLARDVTQNAPAETSQDDGVEHSIQEKDDEGQDPFAKDQRLRSLRRLSESLKSGHRSCTGECQRSGLKPPIGGANSAEHKALTHGVLHQ
jgi:hypothetical protein